MVVPQLAGPVVVLQHELDLHLIGRILVFGELPFTLALEAVLRQRTSVRELWKDVRNSSPDRITWSECGLLAHEPEDRSASWDRGGRVTSVQMLLGCVA